MYRDGCGVTQDETVAATWFQKAAYEGMMPDNMI
jgi:TPR repeat protein